MNHEDAKEHKEGGGHKGSLIQHDHGETLAWCFLPKDGRLRMLSPDGTRKLIRPGTILLAKNPLEMRHQRIHSAERAIDALFFGRSLVLCRVQLRGTILRERQSVGEYKPYERNFILIYGSKMIVLGVRDVTTIVYRLMCDVAEWALLHDHSVELLPDQRLLDAIVAKRAWLDGKIDGKDLILAEIAAEEAWRAIWHAQNLRGGTPVISPYTGIVAWVTRPKTTTETNKQTMVDFEIHRARRVLTDVITPQSDLNAELERRLKEAFEETGSV